MRLDTDNICCIFRYFMVCKGRSVTVHISAPKFNLYLRQVIRTDSILVADIIPYLFNSKLFLAKIKLVFECVVSIHNRTVISTCSRITDNIRTAVLFRCDFNYMIWILIITVIKFKLFAKINFPVVAFFCFIACYISPTIRIIYSSLQLECNTCWTGSITVIFIVPFFLSRKADKRKCICDSDRTVTACKCDITWNTAFITVLLSCFGCRIWYSCTIGIIYR